VRSAKAPDEFAALDADPKYVPRAAACPVPGLVMQPKLLILMERGRTAGLLKNQRGL
jgi:hypothetical protein